MVQDHLISKTKACKIVGFSRSSSYKSTVDWAAKDTPLIDALNKIIAKRARWVFGKCFHRLRSDGHDWNHKRVHRVYCDMKVHLQRRTKKRVVKRQRQPFEISLKLNDV